MHKRIFFKYYTICVMIVFLTVSILGFATSAVIGVRSFNTQSESMERAANKIARMVAIMPKNYYIVAGNIFDASISAIQDTITSDVMVVDSEGRVELSTIRISAEQVNTLIPSGISSSVLSGKIYRHPHFLGSDRRTVGYTVGVPVMRDDGDISGAVFVTTQELNLGDIFKNTFFIFVTCGVAVLMIAFIALIFVTHRMTQPIYQMHDAANAYAKGDFSKRIEVNPQNEFAPLAASFNSMADGIENLDEMRRGFVADVSHELRTPITTITGFVDGILDGTIPPEQHEKYLKTVSEESHRMSRLVSTFLDIAKIQSGQMSYVKKPFDIIETTAKVLFAFEDRIEQAGIDLEFKFDSDRMMAVGDVDAIYRVIYNLIDNAIKFTPQNGKIEVCSTVNDGKINLSVYNTGMGISKEDAAHIFERFYKADKSRGINKRGTGIGLFLVKNIIKEHGEDIILTSKEGEFAKFTFTLPLYTD